MNERKSLDERLKSYEPLWSNWHIHSYIDSGGSGAVYQLKDNRFGEYSALKVITVDYNNQNGFASKNLRLEAIKEKHRQAEMEIRSMRKLKACQHVVQCTNYDIKDTFDDDGNLIAFDILIQMELYVCFENYRLEKGCKFSEEEVIKIAKHIGSALKAAHSNNIMHRDIKPENIFMDDSGNYLLGDFGISKQMMENSCSTIAGSELYIAPEVWHASTKNRYEKPADIYSLGLVLYVLLNNNYFPFTDENSSYIEAQQSWTKRINGEPVPEIQCSNVALKKAVMKACSHNPEERQATIEEFLADIEAAEKNNDTAVEEKATAAEEHAAELHNQDIYEVPPASYNGKINDDSIYEKLDSVLQRADMNDVRAQYKAGMYFLEKGDKRAVTWLNKAAANQYAPAMYTLALMYGNYNGYRGFVNYSSGWLNLLKKSAQHNYFDAQYEYANIMRYGTDRIKANPSEALVWYNKALGNAKDENQKEQVRQDIADLKKELGRKKRTGAVIAAAAAILCVAALVLFLPYLPRNNRIEVSASASNTQMVIKAPETTTTGSSAVPVIADTTKKITTTRPVSETTTTTAATTTPVTTVATTKSTTTKATTTKAKTTKATTAKVTTTKATTTTTAPVREVDPFEVEEMILNHIKYGDPVDPDMLAEVTALTIFGEEFVFVECNEKKGSLATGINFYNGENNTFFYDDVSYPHGDVSDISFIKHCKELRLLSIYFNRISDDDLAFLKDLPWLCDLRLSYNKIKNISNLGELKNLSWLYLNDNELTDISPLENCKKLQVLELIDNKITDISPLKNLTEIHTLGLNDNNISDISALKKLTKMDILWLSRNKISDVSALKGLTLLQSLTLDNNKISNISTLDELTNLCYLDLSNNQISDISTIKNYKRLQMLQITNNPLTDLSPLFNLSCLTTIFLPSDIDQSTRDALAEALPDTDISYY